MVSRLALLGCVAIASGATSCLMPAASRANTERGQYAVHSSMGQQMRESIWRIGDRDDEDRDGGQRHRRHHHRGGAGGDHDED